MVTLTFSNDQLELYRMIAELLVIGLTLLIIYLKRDWLRKTLNSSKQDLNT